MANLQTTYTNEVAPKLKAQFSKTNSLSVPRLEEIVINIGLKEGAADKKIVEEAISQVASITGQRPVATKAKKAIAGFKLRQGDTIGVMVTLRGTRMYDFFEKLVSIVLPRVRDFHGVSTTAFDGRGNYTLGLTEIGIFPEIDAAILTRIKGLQVTIKTTAQTDEEASALLALLGMPFRKERKTK